MFAGDELDLKTSLVGLLASKAASLVRSSHFPLTASMLLRVVVGVVGAEGLNDGTPAEGSLNVSFEGLGDSTCSASPSNISDRVRSSHFPLIISTLWETRWLAHLLGGGEFPEEPVLLESSDPADVELFLDSDPERLMDEVRSRRRVW